MNRFVWLETASVHCSHGNPCSCPCSCPPGDCSGSAVQPRWQLAADMLITDLEFTVAALLNPTVLGVSGELARYALCWQGRAFSVDMNFVPGLSMAV